MTCGNDLNGFGRVCLPVIPPGQFLDAINNHGGYSTDKDAVTKVAQAGGFANADIAAAIMQFITDDFSVVPRVALLEQDHAQLLAETIQVEDKVVAAAARIDSAQQQIANILSQVAGLTAQVGALTQSVAALTSLVDRIAALPSIASQLNH